MPWCPDCKTEYLEGNSVCKDCGKQLVDTLPEEKKLDNYPKLNFDEKVDWMLFKKLYPNDKEGDIVISILKANNIPVLRKYPHAGDYTNIYMGLANEMQIFVPSDLINEAEELIKVSQMQEIDNYIVEENTENFLDAEEFIEDEDAQIESNGFIMPYKTKRMIGIIFILVIILFPLVFLLFNKIGLLNGINIGPIRGPRP